MKHAHCYEEDVGLDIIHCELSLQSHSIFLECLPLLVLFGQCVTGWLVHRQYPGRESCWW